MSGVGIALTAAAGLFNLTCSGSLETTTLNGKKSEPYTTIYRVDLNQEAWCESDCKVQHKFAEISPIVLVLERRDTETLREREFLSNTVNRETGAHSVLGISGLGASSVALKWTGVCEKAEFTGFPRATTKF